MRVIVILFILFLTGFQAMTQFSDVRIHDPVMTKEGDTYYLFGTGMGISVHSSKDLVNWTREKPVFDQAPTWTKGVVPDFKGHIWAPDISFYDGQYYLYYSVSAFAKNTSAIGVVTNTTLNPQSPNFKWVDHGIVIQSFPNRDLWNAIDPNLIVDELGQPWLTFGSFWEGLKLVKLNRDRLGIAQPQEWRSVAKRIRTPLTNDENPGDAAIEAPYIFKKDSMYYLFVSWDYCCRGANSTYKVVVGRSKNVVGPYLDQKGTPMNQGGGTLVVEGNEKWAGAGHSSTYTFEGKDYFIFHAYDTNDNGHSKLKIAPLSWDSDGWPVVDAGFLR